MWNILVVWFCIYWYLFGKFNYSVQCGNFKLKAHKKPAAINKRSKILWVFSLPLSLEDWKWLLFFQFLFLRLFECEQRNICQYNKMKSKYLLYKKILKKNWSNIIRDIQGFSYVITNVDVQAVIGRSSIRPHSFIKPRWILHKTKFVN